MTDTHVKVNAIAPVISYIADGVQTIFPYPFPVLDVTDVRVRVDDSIMHDGITITGARQDNGGDVTFDTAPANGASIILERHMRVERLSDYQIGSNIRADVMNNDFDSLVMMLQQTNSIVERAPRLPVTDYQDQDMSLPAAEADKVIAIWNEDASALKIGPTASAIEHAQSNAEIAVQAAAEASVDASRSKEEAERADQSASEAETSASKAESSASEAENSAARAKDSASTALDSANKSTTQAAEAEDSATRAARSADEAAISAAIATDPVDATLEGYGLIVKTGQWDATVTWVQLADLPSSIVYNTSQLLPDGKLWMTGGSAGQSDNYQFLGTYDSFAGTVSWIRLDDLPVPNIRMNTSVLLPDGKIWMSGGVANDASGDFQFLGTYDSVVGTVTWTQLDSFFAGSDFARNRSALLSDGKIWMTGAEAGDNNYNSQYLGTYDSAKGTVNWVQINYLPGTYVYENTSVLLPDGKIWMTGGASGGTVKNKQFLGTYDSTAGTVSWTRLDDLPIINVTYNTSVLLPDGRIWMSGGTAGLLDNLQFLGTYDAAAGTVTWVQLDDLTFSPALNTSLLLPDGKLWMTGGTAGQSHNYQFLGTYTIAFEHEATPASETASGIVELASVEETIEGTDATKAITPVGLSTALDDKNYATITYVDESIYTTLEGYGLIAKTGQWDAAVTWVQLTDLLLNTKHNTSQLLPDGKLWMTGGFAGVDDNCQFLGTYDATAGTVSWIQLDNLPYTNIVHNTSLLLPDGKIWMTGGWGGDSNNGQYLGSYDSDAGTVSWVQLDNLPASHSHANISALLPDGKIWMTGGQSGEKLNLQFLGTYDSAAKTVVWTQLDNLPGTNVYDNTSVVLPDGKIWMTGGRSGGSSRNRQFLGTYDSAAGTVSWASLDDLPTTNVIHNTSVLLPDGRIWMTGGESGTDNFQFIGTYDAAAGTVSWRQLDNLFFTGTKSNTSLLLPDGKIWMTGGESGSDTYQFLGTYTIAFEHEATPATETRAGLARFATDDELLSSDTIASPATVVKILQHYKII